MRRRIFAVVRKGSGSAPAMRAMLDALERWAALVEAGVQ
jgi:hypothetical protein